MEGFNRLLDSRAFLKPFTGSLHDIVENQGKLLKIYISSALSKELIMVLLS